MLNFIRDHCWVAVCVLLMQCGLVRGADVPKAEPKAPGPAPLLQEALAGPMKEAEGIIFCTRLKYDDGHWYANIGYYCDDENKKAYAGNGRPDVSKLYKLNLRNGEVSVLLDAQGGGIRDPQVHYDGQKILFSYRKAKTDFYHLYEIGTDGSGLKQLTSGEFDDIEAIYLPDGGIAFVSTRCKRWVNCWMTQVAVIYRCDADGRNIQLISANTEHDNTPWVLPDGRILYTRWEYVDRSQVEFHHLWAMNPDGTGQTVFYGNMHPNIVMIDGKSIPGSDKVLVSFSPGHGISDHAGIATIVTTQRGPDDRGAAKALHKGGWTRDPYALSEHCFLAARDKQIVLFNDKGKMEVVYTHKGEGDLHEPRPVMSRPRERVLAKHADLKGDTGRMVLADVYHGRNLPGVKRGEIKKLLILESLPKPVNFSGGPDLVSWLGTFTLERVLGTVPVEPDGSAYFDVPADRQVFFVALDERDLSVKRMQSFTTVRPGEVLGCAGCHEHRAKTPGGKNEALLQALKRQPSKIETFPGLPDVLDFTRDVQPILDKRCVSCHNHEKREGKVVLSGDLGPQWPQSYFSLFAHRLVADGRNGLGNQPPRTIGSSASRLLKLVDGSHYEAKVTPQEWRTLWMWIESGAAYAGTYAGLRNAQEQNLEGLALNSVLKVQAPVLQRRCYSCHSPQGKNPERSLPLVYDEEARRAQARKLNQPTACWERIIFENDPIAQFGSDVLINFSRPRFSPMLLGPLSKAAGGWGTCGEVFKASSDPDYQLMLGAIEKGKQVWAGKPRFATPEFKPNVQYVREMKKFGILPATFDLAKDRIDVFATDEQYWRSFWVRP